VTLLNIFVCETQPIVVEGLRFVLEGHNDFAFAGHAPDIESASRRAAESQSHVLLVGQPPAFKSALPLLARATGLPNSAPIVLWVSELSDMDSFRALQMGARGVLTRTQTISELLECLRVVASGSVWLESSRQGALNGNGQRKPAVRITPREREIIESVCLGMKNKEIATALSITPGTVKVHLMHIFEKTGVKDRFELALQGRQILGTAPGPTTAQHAISGE
jgi:DNA-binding NarL/FixJ family response regulator